MRLHSPTDPGPKGPPASPEQITSALAQIYANLARARALRAGLNADEAAQQAVDDWRKRRAVYLQPSQHPRRGNGIVTTGHSHAGKLPSPEGIR